MRSPAGGEIGEAPPVADEASRFRGSAPIGGHDSDRESVGTTVDKSPPPLRTIREPTVVLAKTVSLRGQFANWPWQSASPVPSAPLPKGGWHGEAVTGGFFFAPVPYTQKYRPKPWLRAVFLHNTIIHFMLPANYKPAATMQSSTRVKITNTAPTHLVAFASLASMVRALPLDI